jgi:hypothetical protein
MAFVKGFFTGIAAAAALGVLLFAGKIYRSASINVHVTDFYFPGWMPLWAVKLHLYMWSHASLLLILGAFVAGFTWGLYKVSMRRV